MSNYTISFAHANGFPAGSYDTFFSYFPDNMNFIALEKYGHSNTKPVNNNWQAQVEELIEHVEKNYRWPKIYLFGSFVWWGYFVSSMLPKTRFI
jgi:hypothetical protein